ncbi:hydroxymethylbilane synthase [Bacillus kwashiorkori]|uniref:hydroxymethylbilane synthase n=1 Tax=Bacillus kwashiorkori TaxID=1522318 RepID=UPI0007804E6B|nr:hydroxymethylbilane synthase [Bacillus kwashiorkori]
MRKIIVGSRRSALALTQTKWVIDKLKELGAPFSFEIKEMVTKGDQILNVTLSKVGGKGLFVKEIEHALLQNDIDFAVHSMKDMPSVLPAGLIIGAIPEREDARDVLLTKKGEKIEDMSAGSIVGTSSLRRQAQILAIRPDLQIKWIRGNIDTRINKLQTEDYDAIILAAAGLNRMNLKINEVTEYLNIEQYIPAVGQGALGIECREEDIELRQWLDKLTCSKTERVVKAERAFLQKMEGSCQVPIGGHAIITDADKIELTAFVAAPDGKTIFKETMTGNDPKTVGEEAARKLIAAGAKKLIDEVLKQNEQ